MTRSAFRHTFQKSLTALCMGLCAACLMIAAFSCSSEKFLGDGEHVLSGVKVESDQKHFSTSPFQPSVKQRPNAKWFTLFKVPLGIYCLSSADSLRSQKRFSKFLRRLGEAPEVYSEQQTAYGVANMQQALNSYGYLHARVDTALRFRGHKVAVTYTLHPGTRHYIKELSFRFASDSLSRVFRQDSLHTLLRRGMPLDLNKLSEERSRIVKAFHERGYYYVNNDFISFDIDTIVGDLGAAVRLNMAAPANIDASLAYAPQTFRRVNVLTESTDLSDRVGEYTDSVVYRGMTFRYFSRSKINKRVFASHIDIRPDSVYCASQVQNTYKNVSTLPALSFTNIHVTPSGDDPSQLDCDIHVHPSKPHSVGIDVEGTNTAGNLGVAMALSYKNKNVFHGSELLSLKARGAYEAITGLEGYNNQNYTEWSVESSLRFPTLLLPFVGLERKRSLTAQSEIKLLFDTQDRPEFHRRVLTGAWAYEWNRNSNTKWLHRFDLVSVNYVYMPWISDTFRRDYLEGENTRYSVLRYSYENLFILKTGYNFVYNSLRGSQNLPTGLYQTNGFQIKAGVELAGNLLFGASKMVRSVKHSDGCYHFLGNAYSQYVKFDFDFAKSLILSEKNSLALHVALGVGVPYGNSTVMPYEKRYFAGGANSVRGWSVRSLGPGAYKGSDGKVNFVNQTGNIKLDLNAEWRTFLFWKLHGAFFIDAGNVWNVRSYPGLEDGVFRFSSFYKQIAVSYGLGLRLNFNYFIIRFDGGMKAIDPTESTRSRLHYPITRPNFSRDFALHFAIGLPF